MSSTQIIERAVPPASPVSPVKATPSRKIVPPAADPTRMGRMVQQDWAPSLLILFLDLATWLLIYGAITSLRGDAFFSGPFAYGFVALLQFAIIAQSLLIIGGYNVKTEMRGLGYTAEHILAMITALAFAALILYGAATFDRTMKPSRGAILGSFVVFTPLSLAYRRRLRTREAKASANRAFLVIGGGRVAADFYRAYREAPNNQRLEFVDPVGTMVGQRIAGELSPMVEGNLAEKLDDFSKRYSGIIVADSIERIDPSLLDQLIRTQFHRTRVYTVESFYEDQWRQVALQMIDPSWPLQEGYQLARTSPYHYAKRVFDTVAAAIGLIVLSPVMLLVGLLVLVCSGRPIIFKQRRVGRDERIFTVYKFRTMRNAVPGERPGNIYTSAHDPRVYPLGRWLRKLRFDELPQLWNVLVGELSLIGPRAEWEECARRYETSIPHYHFRHLVKPGITGWAQVNYPYGESDQDAIEKLKYDLYYIRHYSLKLDAMIVLKTIFTIFAGRGR